MDAAAQSGAIGAASRALGDAWSLHVVDVATGRTVVAHHAEVPRVPASNTKIITAAAALLTFGPDHQFVSEVCVDFHGTVVVRGGGDPALTDDAIEQIARAVAARLRPGARMPRVVLDQGLYPPFTLAPGWSADLLPWEVRPVVPVSVAVPGSTTAHVRGGMQIAAAIGRHTGGAVATGEGTAAPGCERIARVASRPVGDLVREMLLMSDSDIAEVLARNTAIARGLAPTWESVGPALTGAMRDAGFDMAGCAIADGSGLSRHNALRADLLTQVLRSACDAQGRADLRVIATALPEAGRTGTLRDQPGWFDGEQTSHAACWVRAKTGTLSDTCTLSGYVDHPDGHRSAFSLMANGVDGWAARAPVSALVAGLVS